MTIIRSMRTWMTSMATAVAISAFALGAPGGANAVAPIRIGEINSYKAQPAFLEPYRKGMELAIEQVNAAGGIGGRPLELVSRDDNGNPGDAVRAAEELLTAQHVTLLAGGYLSNVGLALADFARQHQVVFIAGEPLTDKIVWQAGNRYTFRLRPSTYMQAAMLVPEAARLHRKRWALVYPNYEYGTSAAATFKQLLQAAQPDVEFVAEQATPLGRIDAGSVVQALDDAKPDAIFNVLFGADLTRFVREGTTRGLFQQRDVVSLLTGEPEYLDALKNDAPDGWIVTGYPWYGIQTPEHSAFFLAYRAKWLENPRLGSVVGYALIQAIASGLRAAHGVTPAALIGAFEGLAVSTPFGPIRFRAIDHQSTMGAFVGRTRNVGGHGEMVDYRYLDGARYLPGDDEVRKLRPAD